MRLSALLMVALYTLPATLYAHHSTSLNFSDEIISIEGQIKSVRWVNPHCSFVLEVTNEAGVTEEWLVELLARIALERQGFDFEALEVGAAVTITGRVGYRPNSLYFKEAELPDGRRLVDPGPLR
jgi:hypothetical protein